MQYIVEKTRAGPSAIVVDFEKAIHSAIREVFGPDTKIRGFRLVCGQLDALAFLPLDHVQEGMAHLRSEGPLEATELVEYFDSTYVSGRIRKRPAARGFAGIRMRKSAPAFPPAVWNVHQTTLDNEHRTNNICEGWNNAFAHLVGHDHPSI